MITDVDEMWDWFVLLGAALLIGLPVLFWTHVLSWLLDHQLVLPATENPWVVLPASSGAGLDERRAVLIALTVLLIVVVATLLRRLIAGRVQS